MSQVTPEVIRILHEERVARAEEVRRARELLAERGVPDARERPRRRRWAVLVPRRRRLGMGGAAQGA